jgi:hypothetical protein
LSSVFSPLPTGEEKIMTAMTSPAQYLPDLRIYPVGAFGHLTYAGLAAVPSLSLVISDNTARPPQISLV